ncbi:MAG: nucleic acid-binding protein [Terriglobia bacterium]|nr:MAG: nucleic acid-binding protein [Terriglobia bacterium]
MRTVFADTFYWAALTSSNDSAHQRALDLSRLLAPDRIVTTDEVLCEYLALFAGARPSVRAQAGRNVAELMKSVIVLLFPQSRDSFLAGLDLYQARPDKGYSLVDCISMQTMKREGLTEVLTNDRHFEQEGFRALFRDVPGS